MAFLKDLLVDALNGFSPRFIPFFLLQLLSAGLIAHLFQKILTRKFKEEKFLRFALIATSVALLVSLAKNSLMIAVIAGAVLITFIRIKELSLLQRVAGFLVATIGVGCGSGSIVQTAIGAAVLFFVILFTPLKE